MIHAFREWLNRSIRYRPEPQNPLVYDPTIDAVVQLHRDYPITSLENPMSFEPWQPDDTDGEQWLTIDPRVDATHVNGTLPVPPNPPPPVGWKYWGKQPVPPESSRLCVKMLHDSTTYPMGAFVRVRVGEQVIAARVEWHSYQGATGKHGCFRGVNLFTKES